MEQTGRVNTPLYKIATMAEEMESYYSAAKGIPVRVAEVWHTMCWGWFFKHCLNTEFGQGLANTEVQGWVS